MMRPLIAAMLLVFAAPACDGALGAASADALDASSLGDVSSPYESDNFVADDAVASDDTAIPPIYPGHPCDADTQCSTGLCWGATTTQGAFQHKVCQLRCVPTEDFTKFCDSDSDCCEGRCCLGCGGREGLCVKN